MSAWQPSDRELDALAHELPVPEPGAERVEHNRTSVLAGATSLRQQSRRTAWPVIAVAVPLAAAAAVAIWLGTRSTAPREQVSVFGDGARYTMASDSLVLDDGALTVAAVASFRVQAPDAELATTDAWVVVAARDAHLTSVAVMRGSVELRVAGAPPTFLSAGQVWTRTIVAQRDTIVPEPPRVAIADDATAPTVSSAPIDSPAPTNPPPKRTTVATTRPDRSTDPNAKAPSDLSQKRDPAPSDPAPKRDPAPNDPARNIATPNPTPKRDPAPNDPARKVAPSNTAPLPGEVDFRAGMAALRANDPSAATKAFASACTAPRAALAEDACFWVGAAARRAGQTVAARDALASFLRQYPSSARAGEAAALLGWIVFEAGDLDGAEQWFRRAANDRVPRVRDSATRGLTAVDRKRH